MEKEIIEKYSKGGVSLESICKEFKIGKIKLKKILLDNNIPLNSKGGQSKYTHNNITTKIEPHSLECKNCGKKFNDYQNKSGAITNHIKECFPNVEIPSSFKRRMYLKDRGEHFHLNFFNKCKIINTPKIKCPMCDWSTTDIDNSTGSLTKHVESLHSSVTEFIELNPDYEIYFNTIKKLNQRNDLFLEDKNFITCKICNEKMKILSNTHLSTHNITSDEYKLQYGDIISKNLHDEFTTRLINLEPKIPYRSSSENEICDFLTELGLEFLTNNKSLLGGIELDIVIPSHNIAIEYNGLYWHSEKKGKTKNYHLDKTKKCLNKNIKLIHIFSDEWNNKKEVIKERLRYILNKNNNKIYARNCKIVKITKEEKSLFLETHHLQGNDKSNIFYGLTYNDVLVSVITLGNLRSSLGHKTKEAKTFEIYRFCNLNVVGGFSKLLKHFIKTHNPNKIITYADRNWSPSDEYCFYGKNGFYFVGYTKPNYYYTKNYNIRLHRFNFRKDKLVKMGFDPNKTENQIMYEEGFDKIWDTGNLKYELVLS
jgi:G:T-mismatch repair DNA endonuclease (very short patch repair protein)